MSESQPPEPLPRERMRLAGLGVELAAAVAGGCLLGYWIDRRLDSLPWATLICSLIGVVGGLYNLLRQALRETPGSSKDKER